MNEHNYMDDYDLTDPESFDALTQKIQDDQKQKAAELAEAYKATFCNPSGQKVLNDLVDRFGLFTAGVAQSEFDLARNDGARSVLLYIINLKGYDKDTLTLNGV